MGRAVADFTILQLHARIAAVCPILGVTATSLTDKTKWVIRFAPTATAAQQAAAATAVLLAPSLAPPPIP